MKAAPIVRPSHAGTLDSGDVMIRIEPRAPGSGPRVMVSGRFSERLGTRISEIVRTTLEHNNVNDVLVRVEDNGAAEWAIEARTVTAIRRGLARAAEEDET